jgi:hypothetical protein
MKKKKMYIARYKIIYKRVIREAKRRENDNYIMCAKNKSKAIWQVIHKETGKTSSQKQDIKIETLKKLRIHINYLSYLTPTSVKSQRNYYRKMGKKHQYLRIII